MFLADHCKYLKILEPGNRLLHHHCMGGQAPLPCHDVLSWRLDIHISQTEARSWNQGGKI